MELGNQLKELNEKISKKIKKEQKFYFLWSRGSKEFKLRSCILHYQFKKRSFFPFSFILFNFSFEKSQARLIFSFHRFKCFGTI